MGLRTPAIDRRVAAAFSSWAPGRAARPLVGFRELMEPRQFGSSASHLAKAEAHTSFQFTLSHLPNASLHLSVSFSQLRPLSVIASGPHPQRF